MSEYTPRLQVTESRVYVFTFQDEKDAITVANELYAREKNHKYGPALYRRYLEARREFPKRAWIFAPPEFLQDNSERFRRVKKTVHRITRRKR